MTYKGIKNILAEFYKRLKEDPTFTAGSSEVLSKLSESADGKLLYNGKEVTASSEIQLISKEDYDNLLVKDETVFYLIVDDQENILISDATILNAAYSSVPTSTENFSNVLTLDADNKLVLVPNNNSTNKDVLDKLTESADGQLLFNGETISTTNVKLITREEYDALETKDEDVIYIITDEDGTNSSLAEQLLDDTQTSNTKTFSSNYINSNYIKKESNHHIIKDIENLTANPIYIKVTDFASTINNSVRVKLDAIRINTTAAIQEASVVKYNSKQNYQLLKYVSQVYADNSVSEVLSDFSYLLIDNNYDVYVQIGSYTVASLDIIFYDNSSSFITLANVESLPTNYLSNGYTAEVGLV